MHTYGTIADQDPNSTNDNGYPQQGVLITLGIGSALAGSLVTIAIILAAVAIICCYQQIKKRQLCLTRQIILILVLDDVSWLLLCTETPKREVQVWTAMQHSGWSTIFFTAGECSYTTTISLVTLKCSCKSRFIVLWQIVTVAINQLVDRMLETTKLLLKRREILVRRFLLLSFCEWI